jgi:hypothetical protein
MIFEVKYFCGLLELIHEDVNNIIGVVILIEGMDCFLKS